jgi:DNA-binding NtrC family response regulator
MRGSIVLEDVSALNASDQAHLLHCLLDGARPDRVICTTTPRIRQLVEQNAFSEAFFYRLNVIAIWLKPLRERREVILMLAIDAMARAAAVQSKSMPNLTPAGMDRVLRYSWPGNIRELDRVMALAVAGAEGGVIDADGIVLTSRGK